MSTKETRPPNSTVALCNLGCSKNLVDGENMVGWLSAAGYRIIDDFESADIILVNTCAFIKEAKQEAIDTVLDAAGFRKNGPCKKLVVCGCFSERYHATVSAEFPEVDHWVGVHTWQQEFERIFHSVASRPFHRKLSDPLHTQYLKISEGCSHRCAFCVIPSIRGNFSSRIYNDIRQEALWLYDQGVRECILVSQDTSYYGRDIKSSLAKLVERLLADTQFPWIRLMYLHPAYIDKPLLDLVAHEPRICPYFDIPLQHIADPLLTAMRRTPLSKGIRELLETIRTTVPDCAIRTSIIVGFPGETRAHFKELVAFLEQFRFEKAGVFPFSPEEDTPAFSMKPRPANRTVTARCEELMAVQREISAEICSSRIGRTLDIIIDRPSDSPGFTVEGRTRWDAPEIDGRVIFKKSTHLPGTIIKATITGAGDYDLFA